MLPAVPVLFSENTNRGQRFFGQEKCMTNQDILQIAMRQSAVDANCRAEDFTREENVVVTSVKKPGRTPVSGTSVCV